MKADKLRIKTPIIIFLMLVSSALCSCGSGDDIVIVDGDEESETPWIWEDGDGDGDEIIPTDGDEGDPVVCHDGDCPRGMSADEAGDCLPFTVTGFREVEVTYSGGGGELELEGLLSIPQSPTACRFPAVILIHGSGPNGRDETSVGQLAMSFGKQIRVFRDFAEALVKAGFVVLRYDKRTCIPANGCSNDYPLPTDDISYWDFAADAAASVDYLKTREEVIGEDIILAGHSQGGQIAPFVADEQSAVSDTVLLAGPYRPIDELMAYQAEKSRALLREIGLTEQEIDDQLSELDLWVGQLAELRAETFSGARIAGILTDWWLEWMDAGDRTPALLAALNTGVLVLQGGYDWNVPPSEAESFRTVLADHEDARVTILPELTHPFVRISQPDWKKITPEDIGSAVDPEATRTLVEWLLRGKVN